VRIGDVYYLGDDGRYIVRLQWDPDHYPNGDKHIGRRAIQLGLKQFKSFVTGLYYFIFIYILFIFYLYLHYILFNLFTFR
jgi:hypothetical protein